MKRLFFTLLMVLTISIASAYTNKYVLGGQRFQLSAPATSADSLMLQEGSDLKPMLSQPLNLDSPTKKKKFKPDFNFFKLRTNPDVKPYKFMDDMTFVGVPLFIAGIAIKGDKASFRQDYNDEFHPNTRLITKFKTSIDDYTQYFGPALTIGLKLGGYEGRSDWPRFLASAAISYGTMAILVNGIKYTASEMRPDGSTANSWPSGHTATSFVGATILHKEYGLTRSPWFSVAGYGIATATGIMRVLNNRHWISDILSGAGIGILSTELGYALSDVFFKGKGLLRGDLPATSTKPSFFCISMGFGLGTHSLLFTPEDLKDPFDALDFYDLEKNEYEDLGLHVKFRPATTVDVEGAYFFNKIVGVGGRLRVRAMTSKEWGNVAESTRRHSVNLGNELMGLYVLSNPDLTTEQVLAKQAMVKSQMLGDPAQGIQPLIASEEISIESDHLTEFQASAGLYFNIPLGKRFSIGTKALIGRSITQELDIDAHFTGDKKILEYSASINQEGIQRLDITTLQSSGQSYDVTWNYLTLGAKSSTSYSTGLSLTYRYKSNFSWRIFADYDYSRKEFTLSYNPYHYLKEAVPNVEPLYYGLGSSLDAYEFQKRKYMHHFTLGASLVVDF